MTIRRLKVCPKCKYKTIALVDDKCDLCGTALVLEGTKEKPAAKKKSAAKKPVAKKKVVKKKPRKA